MLGILGAIEAEIALVRSRLVDTRQTTVGSTVVSTGRYETPAGTHRDIALARCGVGKVNAALAVAALARAGVDRALFTGVAGGVAPGLAVGDLVVATDLVQHDVDVTALGYPRGQLIAEPLAWSADPWLAEVVAGAGSVALSGSGNAVHRGRIVSGDQFIADPGHAHSLHREFGALCAEMEGAAFAQACAAYRLPFAVVRALSDTADTEAPGEFTGFLARASEVGLALVDAVVDGLG